MKVPGEEGSSEPKAANAPSSRDLVHRPGRQVWGGAPAASTIITGLLRNVLTCITFFNASTYLMTLRNTVLRLNHTDF